MRNETADGLRGFASVNVVITHFVAAFWPALLRYNYDGLEMQPGPMSKIDQVLSTPPVTFFFNGQFPVLVFFVLSGFVLASPAISARYDLLRARAVGRYFRLNIPIAVVCLTAWVLYQSGAYYNHEASALSGSKWLDHFGSGNISIQDMLEIVTYRGLLGDGTLIPPLWTLRMEFLGSMLVLATMSLTPPGRWWVGVPLAALGLIIAKPDGETYLLCFLAGAAINWLSLRRGWAAAGIGLGCYFGAYQSASGLYSWLPLLNDAKTSYNAIGAVLLVVGLCKGPRPVSMFGSPFAKYLGRISYMLYLVHFPILLSLGSFLVVTMGRNPAGIIVTFVVFAGTSVVAATILTRFIDGPAVRAGHEFAALLEGKAWGRTPREKA